MAYATVQEYRDVIKSTAQHDDSRVQIALDSATSYIDRRCGRKFTSINEVKSYRLYREFTVRISDIYNIDVVSFKGIGEVVYTDLDDSNYHFLPDNGIPFIAISLAFRFIGDLRIEGDWGWEEVPPPIKSACISRASIELIDGPRATGALTTVGERGRRFISPDVNSIVDAALDEYTRLDVFR